MEGRPTPSSIEETLRAYWAEIARHPSLPPEDERDLLARARAGDASARRAVVRSLLGAVAEIALACPVPAWADPLVKMQEANLVLMRSASGHVEELRADLASAIPEALRGIARRFPDGPESGYQFPGESPLK
ncbi:MAG: hypothetical protein HY775_01580 [Acidobacteria bacterium]|nr:hypothetical protein [Acidobacteriota bacterium]